jgi:hypothetical protein
MIDIGKTLPNNMSSATELKANYCSNTAHFLNCAAKESIYTLYLCRWRYRPGGTNQGPAPLSQARHRDPGGR